MAAAMYHGFAASANGCSHPAESMVARAPAGRPGVTVSGPSASRATAIISLPGATSYHADRRMHTIEPRVNPQT